MPDVARVKITLTGVRLSFPDIWKAKAIGDGDPKFSASFFLDKTRDAGQINALRDAIKTMAVAQWPGTAEDAQSRVRDLRKAGKIRFCLHEGTEKDYEGYNDKMMFVNATSNNRPTIVNRDRTALVAEDGKPYAGCYVDAKIELWVQDNQWGKGINADLRGIQFVKDGDPFGAAPVSPEEFTDYSEGEEKASSGAGAAAAADRQTAKASAPDDDEIW